MSAIGPCPGCEMREGPITMQFHVPNPVWCCGFIIIPNDLLIKALIALMDVTDICFIKFYFDPLIFLFVDMAVNLVCHMVGSFLFSFRIRHGFVCIRRPILYMIAWKAFEISLIMTIFLSFRIMVA